MFFFLYDPGVLKQASISVVKEAFTEEMFFLLIEQFNSCHVKKRAERMLI